MPFGVALSTTLLGIVCVMLSQRSTALPSLVLTPRSPAPIVNVPLIESSAPLPGELLSSIVIDPVIGRLTLPSPTNGRNGGVPAGQAAMSGQP